MRSNGGSTTVAREILRRGLQAIVDDMSATLEHNASSDTVSEARDYAVALTTTGGEVVVGENAVHIPSLAMTAGAILDYYEFNLRAGDLIVTNDPYSGGTHIQDFSLFAPVHVAGEFLACLLMRVHMPDLGGQIVGGYNPAAVELWAEGVRIQPVKLARFGRIDKDIHRTILLNSRLPEQVSTLLEAMLAACALGQDRVHAMVGRHGAEAFLDGLQYALEYSEASARTAMQQWPNGVFGGAARLGHDCTGRSPEVRCRLELKDGNLKVDFSGSASQSASFVNSAWAWTCGNALLPIVAAFGDEMPINSGLLRVIRFCGGEGSLIRPTYPAAVGWGQVHPGAEIVNAVSGALAACTGLSLPTIPVRAIVSCRFPRYRMLSLDSLVYPGASATEGAHGWGPPNYLARGRLPSIEKCELAFPEIFIQELEMMSEAVPRTQWQGAPGCRLCVLLRTPAAVTACVASPPTGNAESGHEQSRIFIADGREEYFAIDGFWANRPVSGGMLTLETAGGANCGAVRRNWGASA